MRRPGKVLSTRQQLFLSISRPLPASKEAAPPGEAGAAGEEGGRARDGKAAKRNGFSPIKKVEIRSSGLFSKRERTVAVGNSAGESKSSERKVLMMREERGELMATFSAKKLRRSLNRSSTELTLEFQKSFSGTKPKTRVFSSVEKALSCLTRKERGGREAYPAASKTEFSAKKDHSRSLSADLSHRGEDVQEEPVSMISEPCMQTLKTLPEPFESLAKNGNILNESNPLSVNATIELAKRPKPKHSLKAHAKKNSSERQLEKQKMFQKKNDFQHDSGMSSILSSLNKHSFAGREKFKSGGIPKHFPDPAEFKLHTDSEESSNSAVHVSSVSATTETITRLLDKLADSKKKVIELTTMMVMFKEAQQRTIAENAQLKEEVSNLKEQNARLEAKAESQKKLEAQLSEQFKEKKSEIATLQATLRLREELFSDIKQKIGQLSSPSSEANAKIQSLEEQLSFKELEINTLRETIEQFEDNFSNPSQDMEELLSEVISKTKEIRHLKDQVSTQEQIIAKLREILSEKDKVISKYISAQIEENVHLTEPSKECIPDEISEAEFDHSMSLVSLSPKETTIGLLVTQVSQKDDEIFTLLAVEQLQKTSIQQLSDLVGEFDRRIRDLRLVQMDEVFKRKGSVELRKIDSEIVCEKERGLGTRKS